MTDRTKEYKADQERRRGDKRLSIFEIEGDLPRERAKVTLHFSVVMEATCTIIRHHLCIPHDAYLDSKGRLVCDERDHRHGSVSEDLLDPEPSAEILEGLRAIATIQGLKTNFMKGTK